MLKITLITVGALSEQHWKDAAAEYKKRLSGRVALTDLCLKDERLPQSPSDAEIARALDAEADRIIGAIPKRALVVPLCVEGSRITSEALAAKIEDAASDTGEICFIIGSSYGLSDKVKALAAFKLSLSALTFPHQLAKVMLLEAIYRSVMITSGSKYHK